MGHVFNPREGKVPLAQSFDTTAVNEDLDLAARCISVSLGPKRRSLPVSPIAAAEILR
jgi:hypothetical protein